MPKLLNKVPGYRHHKASGCAVVTLDGRTHYLGPWGSRESRVEYDRLVAEWLANCRNRPTTETPTVDLTVVELAAAYWRHAKEYYRLPDGRISQELGNIKDALRPLKKLYGHTLASKFGPLALKTVRKAMVDADLCRTTINRRVGRIKRLFKWAVGNEMIPAQVFHGLIAVEGLRAGRENVREPVPVKPVHDDHVQAVLSHVSSPIRAMIETQRLSGCRPGEVCRIRGAEIDRSAAGLGLPTFRAQDAGPGRTPAYPARSSGSSGPDAVA